MVIRIAVGGNLHKYRFALRTADFYICRTCGTYLGAVLSDADGIWSTVNLRLSAVNFAAEPVSYGGEDEAVRIARRKRVWTPTRIIVAA